jgi:hypothetical protein
MMEAKQMTAVIGTFADRSQAEHFVAQLRQAGFRDDEIGMTTPAKEAKGPTAEEDIAVGAVAGGALGAFAGAVATGLIPGIGPVIAAGLLAGIVGGAAAGATAGGLIGALVGLGVPEAEARRYEQEFLAGRTLVVVQSAGRAAEALAILNRCQATS